MQAGVIVEEEENISVGEILHSGQWKAQGEYCHKNQAMMFKTMVILY